MEDFAMAVASLAFHRFSIYLSLRLFWLIDLSYRCLIYIPPPSDTIEVISNYDPNRIDLGKTMVQEE